LTGACTIRSKKSTSPTPICPPPLSLNAPGRSSHNLVPLLRASTFQALSFTYSLPPCRPVSVILPFPHRLSQSRAFLPDIDDHAPPSPLLFLDAILLNPLQTHVQTPLVLICLERPQFEAGSPCCQLGPKSSLRLPLKMNSLNIEVEAPRKRSWFCPTHFTPRVFSKFDPPHQSHDGDLQPPVDDLNLSIRFLLRSAARPATTSPSLWTTNLPLTDWIEPPQSLFAGLVLDSIARGFRSIFLSVTPAQRECPCPSSISLHEVARIHPICCDLTSFMWSGRRFGFCEPNLLFVFLSQRILSGLFSPFSTGARPSLFAP